MKSKSRQILDKSIDAMVAAIEIYNKPAFSYREELFAVLAVNAWELLLKARILQLDGNKLTAITEYEFRTNADGTKSKKRYRKINRSGNHSTISLLTAYDRLLNHYGDKIDPKVRENLIAIIEIRDNSIHFINKDFELKKNIHEISFGHIACAVAVFALFYQQGANWLAGA